LKTEQKIKTEKKYQPKVFVDTALTGQGPLKVRSQRLRNWSITYEIQTGGKQQTAEI
jgi:hypothetical protein